MQEAVPAGEGAMTAVLGMSLDEVENEINLLPKEGVCEISNDNSNTQIVVSGTKSLIENLNSNLKKKNKKGILLPVSAPFHCSLMKKASLNMEERINGTDFSKPHPSIISNVTAKDENDINKIKQLLIEQIVSKVRWRESVNYMIKKGISDFIEIGPGKVLSSLVKKMNKEVKVSNISFIKDIKND